MKYRARFSIGSLIKGCQIGFSGPGISLIWSSVFGIWFRRVSGLKLCLGGGTPKITLGITETKLWVEIKGLKNAIGDPRRAGIRNLPILWCGIQEMLFPVKTVNCTFLKWYRSIKTFYVHPVTRPIFAISNYLVPVARSMKTFHL